MSDDEADFDIGSFKVNKTPEATAKDQGKNLKSAEKTTNPNAAKT